MLDQAALESEASLRACLAAASLILSAAHPHSVDLLLRVTPTHAPGSQLGLHFWELLSTFLAAVASTETRHTAVGGACSSWRLVVLFTGPHLSYASGRASADAAVSWLSCAQWLHAMQSAVPRIVCGLAVDNDDSLGILTNPAVVSHTVTAHLANVAVTVLDCCRLSLKSPAQVARVVRLLRQTRACDPASSGVGVVVDAALPLHATASIRGPLIMPELVPIGGSSAAVSGGGGGGGSSGGGGGSSGGVQSPARSTWASEPRSCCVSLYCTAGPHDLLTAGFLCGQLTCALCQPCAPALTVSTHDVAAAHDAAVFGSTTPRATAVLTEQAAEALVSIFSTGGTDRAPRRSGPNHPRGTDDGGHVETPSRKRVAGGAAGSAKGVTPSASVRASSLGGSSTKRQRSTKKAAMPASPGPGDNVDGEDDDRDQGAQPVPCSSYASHVVMPLIVVRV